MHCLFFTLNILIISLIPACDVTGMIKIFWIVTFTNIDIHLETKYHVKSHACLR